MNVQEFEVELRTCIRKAQEKGYRVVPSMTLNRLEQMCCPIGAVRLINGGDTRDADLDDAINIGVGLGLRSEEVDSFIGGFDDPPDQSDNEELAGDEFYQLGRKFREEFCA